MKKLFIFFALSLYLNANQINQELDDISHELATCSAYFALTGEAVINDKDLQKRAKALSNLASDIGLYYTIKANREKDIAEKVFLARYELSLNNMAKEIDNHYANFSILTNKYQKNCNKIISYSQEKLNLQNNVGFLQNQKYVCINRGMIINNKVEKIMSEEEAFKFPIRFYIDDNNVFNTDTNLKLPLFNKDKQIYKNEDTTVMLNVESNKRQMFLVEKKLSNVPVLYMCEETDNWTLAK